MFKMRTLLVLGAAFMLVGCNQPQQKAADDGMDYDQKTDPDVTPFAMYMVGSHWTWTPAEVVADKKDLCEFSKVEGSAKLKYEFTVTQAMMDDWLGFKFVAGGSWSEQYGVEDIDIEACNDAFKKVVGFGTGETALADFRDAHKKGASDRSNVEPAKYNSTTAPDGIMLNGKFVITYDPLDFRTAKTDDCDYTYHFVIDYTAPAVA